MTDNGQPIIANKMGKILLRKNDFPKCGMCVKMDENNRHI